jgi:hypothetical protein
MRFNVCDKALHRGLAASAEILSKIRLLHHCTERQALDVRALTL